MYNAYLEESMNRLKSVIDDSGTRPILFIGTGLSMRYLNAPNWVGLLDMLIHRNPKCNYPIAYYTQNCESNPHIASLLIEEYNKYAWDNYRNGVFPENLYEPNNHNSMFFKFEICRIFERIMENFNLDDHPLSEEIEQLRALKPHAIITTNYDKMLENIFPEHSITVGQQVIKSKESLRIGQILKIHGCMDNPEEIIISKEDYEMFHNKQKYLTAKLLTYFMEHPIIFLGYSLSDSNIKKILLDIAEMVCESPEEIVDNIWFVEWSKDPISDDYKPSSDKYIPLDDGKSIRTNYVLLHTFEELFKNLNQGDVSSVNALQNLEDKIYNIVKSKSISDLKVDYLTMSHIEDEDTLAKLMGFKTTSDVEQGEIRSVSVIGVGVMSDPEQIKLTFPFRISDIAQELGLKGWYYANKLIEEVAKQTGVNIKETSNRYHCDMGIKENQPQHRYSVDTIKLLEKVLNKEEYTVYDENNNLVSPEIVERNLEQLGMEI
ncbi:TPA: SIR2 family protein [Bacillus mobilis]|uniref:SIR2 family protein n=2 Tax=Bacillus mobilis TaxID=2026190 RepID=UPI00164389F0|nr:SIR2 family protein [Bacillus mobilis]MED4385025.1 SIR2 family protein [Bacillus mobilis]HDX9638956.1 SIR2 family protein [Bacillus mobilis]